MGGDRRLVRQAFLAKDVHGAFELKPRRSGVVTHFVDDVTGFETLRLAAGKAFGRLHLMAAKHIHTSAPRRSSIVTRDRPSLRRLVRQVHHDFVHVTPAPAFRWVITLDDGVPGRMEMGCSVTAGRLIATADMTAFAAEPQMQPDLSGLQAFLATERARLDGFDRGRVDALVGYLSVPSSCSSSSMFQGFSASSRQRTSWSESTGLPRKA
ncbi:hypothetical protein GA0004734_00041230 [Rhizobium sp. 9140]|nr:hypothetical protein GA0004734_00041230 [Rhizobium sp. 9140]